MTFPREEAFRREWRFFFNRKFRVLLLAVALVGCFLVRLSATQAQALKMFVGDDEYWHLHIVEQMVTLGYRPAVDHQSWVPQGREIVHPPLYHYLVFALSRLFSLKPFTVMFYIGPFTGVLAAFNWFLLCRELYVSWFGGLVGASVYAVLPLIATGDAVGCARPQSLSEALMPLALFFFHVAHRSQKRTLSPLSGIIFGLSALTWEASMFVHLPLIFVFWILTAVEKKPTRKTGLLCLTTAGVALSMALPYYILVYMRYGIWGNTPSLLLSNTPIFWRPDTTFLLYSYIVGQHVFLLLAAVSFPFLFFTHDLSRDYLALSFMAIGVLSLFFGGLRLITEFLGFGIFLVFTSMLHKVWESKTLFPNSSSKIKFALILLMFILVSGVYTFHFISVNISPSYRELSSLRSSNVQPDLAVICYISDASFLLGHNFKTPWDGYMEHLPSWATNQSLKVMKVYLATGEDEALGLMRELNASHILARLELTHNSIINPLCEALGVDTYVFDYVDVVEEKPVFAKDPETEQPILLRFDDRIVGYELAPKGEAKNLLLSKLIWNNQTGLLLRNEELMPQPPEHFRLVWMNPERTVFLYEVT